MLAFSFETRLPVLLFSVWKRFPVLQFSFEKGCRYFTSGSEASIVAIKQFAVGKIRGFPLVIVCSTRSLQHKSDFSCGGPLIS